MENKKWHKKINTIAFTFLACMPIFILIFDLFRNGFSYDLTNIGTLFSFFESNPITSILENMFLNVFNMDNTPSIILAVGFGWFLFVEMIEIIVMALFYFLDAIKSFFDTSERRFF